MTYNGDTNYSSSTSGTILQTINAASTLTTLTSSGSSSVFGQGVTFTATVSSGSLTGLTGTVTFSDGGTSIGTAGLVHVGSAYLATFPTSFAVVGTHTHIPTADTRILPGGTAYQTDAGMTGPYHSVIGVEKQLILERFLTQLPMRMEAARHGAELHGVIVEVDEASGKAASIRRVEVSG